MVTLFLLRLRRRYCRHLNVDSERHRPAWCPTCERRVYPRSARR